jgi:hypothetical protein
MARKEHKQLNIKIIKQAAVISSIKVLADSLKNFKEVSTKKQNPKKLDEAFNICGDFLSSINAIL